VVVVVVVVKIYPKWGLVSLTTGRGICIQNKENETMRRIPPHHIKKKEDGTMETYSYPLRQNRANNPTRRESPAHFGYVLVLRVQKDVDEEGMCPPRCHAKG